MALSESGQSLKNVRDERGAADKTHGDQTGRVGLAVLHEEETHVISEFVHEFRRQVHVDEHARHDMAFEDLPHDLLLRIMSLVDLPTLGQLARVSKRLKVLAEDDYLWTPHLVFLFNRLFGELEEEDGVLPICQRSDWSSSLEFRKWLEECQPGGRFGSQEIHNPSPLLVTVIKCLRLMLTNSLVMNDEALIRENLVQQGEELKRRTQWLFRRASSKEYYAAVAQEAMDGVKYSLIICLGTQRCPGCGDDLLDGYNHDECWSPARTFQTYFGGLPNLAVFNPPALICSYPPE